MQRFLTKNQLLLLRLFYTNPQKSFYMQEIGKILGKKPGVFQRTLNVLTEEGFLRSEYRAHARYFQANTEYALYPEFRKIVAKTVGVEVTLRKLVHRLKDIKLAILYGSFVKGTERQDSDVDLLIVGKPQTEDKLLKELLRFEKEIQREINYKLYSEKEFRKKHAEGDAFIQEVMRNQKIVLKGDPDAI